MILGDNFSASKYFNYAAKIAINWFEAHKNKSYVFYRMNEYERAFNVSVDNIYKFYLSSTAFDQLTAYSNRIR